MKKEIYENAQEIQKIFNRAVTIAQDENRKKGIPNVYSRNGKIYWEMPDGSITYERPEILKSSGNAKITTGNN